MKILMKNKKKQGVYISIFVLAVGFTVWIWVGAGSDTVKVPDSVIQQAFLDQDLFNAETEVTGFSGLLPYGNGFKIDLFSDEKFLELKPTAELVVFPEELGQENPFSSNLEPESQGIE